LFSISTVACHCTSASWVMEKSHPRPGQGNAGGEKQHNGNTLLYRPLAACVNAAAPLLALLIVIGGLA
jgi:hypothetical protein